MRIYSKYSLVLGCFIVVYILVITSCEIVKDRLRYLEQEPPGTMPEIFAPGLVSLFNRLEFGSVFSQEADEFYFAVDSNGRSEIKWTRLINNKWELPSTLVSSLEFGCNDPFLSQDENRLYFISNKSLDDDTIKTDYDIWYIEREGGEWGTELKNAGFVINSNSHEYYMSLSRRNYLYFSSNVNSTEINRHNFNIYYSAYINGAFQTPVLLSDSINSGDYEADVFIAPDESYMIFCSIRKEGFGQGDLYISFKDKIGGWSKAKNMGQIINTEGHELCPFVSKDGKYFFYTSNQDIYWVDPSIIEKLKTGNDTLK